MNLRPYTNSDASIIASWIQSEEELYNWSADRYNKFPISGADIEDNYAPQIESGRFFPFSLTNDSGDVIGHFIIRYLREDDDSTVRIGFVIINPELRGKGVGAQMLRLGIEYVKEHFPASIIDLGVFENNESARRCYEAVGFKECGREELKMQIGTYNCIFMEMFI